MANNYAHFDMFDDTNFQVKVESGFVKDVDLQIWTDDKQMSVRLHREQAKLLLQDLKDQFE